MLKPIILLKSYPREKTKGPGFQARRKVSRKFVKKLVVEEMSNKVSLHNPDEIRVNWKLFKRKHFGDTQGKKRSDRVLKL